MSKYKNLGVEHYYSFPSSYSYERKKERLDMIVSSKQYVAARKYDGNFVRVVVEDDFRALQTRGVSKNTGEPLEIQNKVFFWNDIDKAFDKPTVLLGECYFPEGIDRDVSGILRMLDWKARSVQSEKYYKAYCETNKVTAADKRKIEESKFFDHKLQYMIFDVLVYDGVELFDKTLEERIPYIAAAVKKINSPLVNGVKYFEAEPESFYQTLDNILAVGGEGLVLSRKDSLYDCNAKTARAWKTLKCKRELQETIDVFVIGTVPAHKDFTGEDMSTCMWWEDIHTHEILNGDYYNAYALGKLYVPVSKGYAMGWPGAIKCGVYDKEGNIIPLANVAGLPESLKEDLKNNYPAYHMRPLTISGMMISEGAKTNKNNYSVRHPKLIGFRDDLTVKDCTLAKICREE